MRQTNKNNKIKHFICHFKIMQNWHVKYNVAQSDSDLSFLCENSSFTFTFNRIALIIYWKFLKLKKWQEKRQIFFVCFMKKRAQTNARADVKHSNLLFWPYGMTVCCGYTIHYLTTHQAVMKQCHTREITWPKGNNSGVNVDLIVWTCATLVTFDLARLLFEVLSILLEDEKNNCWSEQVMSINRCVTSVIIERLKVPVIGHKLAYFYHHWYNYLWIVAQ